MSTDLQLFFCKVCFFYDISLQAQTDFWLWTDGGSRLLIS